MANIGGWGRPVGWPEFFFWGDQKQYVVWDLISSTTWWYSTVLEQGPQGLWIFAMAKSHFSCTKGSCVCPNDLSTSGFWPHCFPCANCFYYSDINYQVLDYFDVRGSEYVVQQHNSHKFLQKQFQFRSSI